jgi:hypothetical protein
VVWLERVAPWAGRVSLTSRFFWLVVIVTVCGLLYLSSLPLRSHGAVSASLDCVWLEISIVCYDRIAPEEMAN